MRPTEPPRISRRSVWIEILFSCAGVLGACGIGVGAAGSHAGGGDLARLSSTFLLVHAGAVLALGAAAGRRRRAWPFVSAGLLLAVGVGAFSGDLAVVAFTGNHILKLLAPSGGMLLILGWLAVAVLPWISRENRAD